MPLGLPNLNLLHLTWSKLTKDSVIRLFKILHQHCLFISIRFDKVKIIIKIDYQTLLDFITRTLTLREINLNYIFLPFLNWMKSGMSEKCIKQNTLCLPGT